MTMVVLTIFRIPKFKREDAVFRHFSFGCKNIYEVAPLSRSAYHHGTLRVSANLHAHPMAHGISKEAHNPWHLQRSYLIGREETHADSSLFVLV
jgi:hypothetical protein